MLRFHCEINIKILNLFYIICIYSNILDKKNELLNNDSFEACRMNCFQRSTSIFK